MIEQLGLDLSRVSSHPDVSRDLFPNNYDGSAAGSIIDADLRAAHNQLIITGFTSLEKIVAHLAGLHGQGTLSKHVRILLGHEPVGGSPLWSRTQPQLQQGIVDYWLEQGISISNCALVVQAMEVLKQGRVTGALEVRTSDKRVVHAKIYWADDAITTGSSNFSASGLQFQIESNVRFTRDTEPERWRVLSEYAEWVWEQGRDFMDGLLELLEQLLSHVTCDTADGSDQPTGEDCGSDEFLEHDASPFRTSQEFRLR